MSSVLKFFNILLLSCSLLFLLERFRMSQACLHMQSEHLRKATACFPVCLRKKKCSSKLYTIRTIPHRTLLRPFASVGSLDTNVAGRENNASGVSTAKNFQRWDNRSNCCRFPLVSIVDLMHVIPLWVLEFGGVNFSENILVVDRTITGYKI